jgi:hypothetical protein
VLTTQGKEGVVLTDFDREAATTIVVVKEQHKQEEHTSETSAEPSSRSMRNSASTCVAPAPFAHFGGAGKEGCRHGNNMYGPQELNEPSGQHGSTLQ